MSFEKALRHRHLPQAAGLGFLIYGIAAGVASSVAVGVIIVGAAAAMSARRGDEDA